MSETTHTQIFFGHFSGKSLEITDLLSFDCARSKIAVTVKEEQDVTCTGDAVRFFLEPGDVKLFCTDLIAHAFMGFEASGGEPDLSPGRVIAKHFSLKKEVKYRAPYVMRLVEGVGEINASNQIKMVKAKMSLTLQMSENEARKIALIVRDYIFQWETVHFRQRQEKLPVSVLSATRLNARATAK